MLMQWSLAEMRDHEHSKPLFILLWKGSWDGCGLKDSFK